MFRPKHVHRWVEIARTYAPPISPGLAVDHVDRDTAERFALGVTTLVFSCADETCGWLKKIEALGREVPRP